MARQGKKQQTQRDNASSISDGVGTDEQNHNLSDKLRFLESMEKIDRAIVKTSDYDRKIDSVLATMLDILDCDRIGLLYPCNPDASSFKVKYECAKPGYETGMPGKKQPMEEGLAYIYRQALGSDEALVCGPGGELEVPEKISISISLKSQIIMVLRPRVGEPWFFSVQQCERQ